MNEETKSPDARAIPLTERQYLELERAMQWPEDLPKWDRDHDTTPTNLADILGNMTTI
jgi:hypothetical protein